MTTISSECECQTCRIRHMLDGKVDRETVDEICGIVELGYYHAHKLAVHGRAMEMWMEMRGIGMPFPEYLACMDVAEKDPDFEFLPDDREPCDVEWCPHGYDSEMR